MIENVAAIVAAFVKRNQVPSTELPALIASVRTSLAALSQIPAAAPPALAPAVPIRRSVLPDKIVCLECGYAGLMLKRHLMTLHGTNPDEYRTRWGLKSDYPMVAPNYAARRSDLAKQSGLGTRRGRARLG
jgi:predicted transcriptional regulator